MNLEGIYNESDFRKQKISISRNEFEFPLEDGINKVFGKLVLKYWGKRDNLILLLITNDDRKLKFSLWKNTNYYFKSSEQLSLDGFNFMRNVKEGSMLMIGFENKKNSNVTKVKKIILL